MKIQNKFYWILSGSLVVISLSVSLLLIFGKSKTTVTLQTTIPEPQTEKADTTETMKSLFSQAYHLDKIEKLDENRLLVGVYKMGLLNDNINLDYLGDGNPFVSTYEWWLYNPIQNQMQFHYSFPAGVCSSTQWTREDDVIKVTSFESPCEAGYERTNYIFDTKRVYKQWENAYNSFKGGSKVVREGKTYNISGIFDDACAEYRDERNEFPSAKLSGIRINDKEVLFNKSRAFKCEGVYGGGAKSPGILAELKNDVLNIFVVDGDSSRPESNTQIAKLKIIDRESYQLDLIQ